MLHLNEYVQEQNIVINIFSCVEKKSIALDMEIPVTPVTPDPPVTPTGNSFNLRVTLYSILVLLLVCF